MAASADPVVAGAVLCGGASRRMGVDKATMVVDEGPLVLRAVDALGAAGISEVVAVGGRRDALTSIGLVVVDDRWPGEGPLGGIITALGHHEHADIVVVLACDLLAPPPDAVSRLVDAVVAGADAAVPVVAGRAQWLFAAWSSAGVGPLRDAFMAGARAPRAALDVLTVAALDDIDHTVALDADTPDDLREPRDPLPR